MFDYFKFDLYGDTWGEKVESGKFIFQDHNNIVGVDNVLPFLVFHYIVDYNLVDLELFFRLAGFSAFSQEELEEPIVHSEVINLVNKENAHRVWSDVFLDEERAKQYIEKALGEGVISRFKDIKKKQLLHEKVKLLEKTQKLEHELESYTLSKTEPQHYSK